MVWSGHHEEGTKNPCFRLYKADPVLLYKTMKIPWRKVEPAIDDTILESKIVKVPSLKVDPAIDDALLETKSSQS